MYEYGLLPLEYVFAYGKTFCSFVSFSWDNILTLIATVNVYIESMARNIKADVDYGISRAFYGISITTP